MKLQPKKATYYPDPLPYRRAPAGAPDKFVTTADVTFSWRNVSASLMRALPVGTLRIGDPADTNPGHLTHSVTDGIHSLFLEIPAPFFFAVSVAPNFRRALPAALPHDYIYQHAEELAAVLGISVREVLHIADRWFLAQLSASGFLFKYTYFVFVRIFGYYFHRLTTKARAVFTPKPDPA